MKRDLCQSCQEWPWVDEDERGRKLCSLCRLRDMSQAARDDEKEDDKTERRINGPL